MTRVRTIAVWAISLAMLGSMQADSVEMLRAAGISGANTKLVASPLLERYAQTADANEQPSPGSAAATVIVYRTAFVTARNSVNIRAAGSLQADIVTKVKEGERVTVLDELNEDSVWVRVRTPDGQEGYAYAQYLGDYPLGQGAEITLQELNAAAAQGEWSGTWQTSQGDRKFDLYIRAAGGDNVRAVGRVRTWSAWEVFRGTVRDGLVELQGYDVFDNARPKDQYQLDTLNLSLSSDGLSMTGRWVDVAQDAGDIVVRKSGPLSPSFEHFDRLKD